MSIIKNTTEIEAWISEKAHYRRFGTRDKFIYPYSKGWRFNLQQVFTWDCTPIGDGIHWPVIEGCDQYTLTVILFYFILYITVIYYINF